MGRIVFEDESRFYPFHDDRRSTVCRRPGGINLQWKITRSISFGGASIMIWDGISLMTSMGFIVVNRSILLTAGKYIKNILEEHLLPFAPFNVNNFMLMPARAVMRFQRREPETHWTFPCL